MSENQDVGPSMVNKKCAVCEAPVQTIVSLENGIWAGQPLADLVSGMDVRDIVDGMYCAKWSAGQLKLYVHTGDQYRNISDDERRR